MYRILDFTIKKGKERREKKAERGTEGQAVGIPACRNRFRSSMSSSATMEV